MPRAERPANPHTQRMSVYLKPEWAQELDTLALADGVSLNQVIRAALVDYFKRRGVKLT